MNKHSMNIRNKKRYIKIRRNRSENNEKEAVTEFEE